MYKLKSIGVGGQFLSIVSELVRLDSKVSASVDEVLGLAQGSVLGPLLSYCTSPHSC